MVSKNSYDIRTVSIGAFLRDNAANFDSETYSKISKKDMKRFIERTRGASRSNPRLAGALAMSSQSEDGKLLVVSGKEILATAVVFAAALAELARETNRASMTASLSRTLADNAPAPEGGSFSKYPAFEAAKKILDAEQAPDSENDVLPAAALAWRDAVLNGSRLLVVRGETAEDALSTIAALRECLDVAAEAGAVMETYCPDGKSEGGKHAKPKTSSKAVKKAKRSKFKCSTTGKHVCTSCGKEIERGETIRFVDVKYADGSKERLTFCSKKHRDTYCDSNGIPQ